VSGGTSASAICWLPTSWGEEPQPPADNRAAAEEFARFSDRLMRDPVGTASTNNSLGR
jgi:hypothetical protein